MARRPLPGSPRRGGSGARGGSPGPGSPGSPGRTRRPSYTPARSLSASRQRAGRLIAPYTRQAGDQLLGSLGEAIGRYARGGGIMGSMLSKLGPLGGAIEFLLGGLFRRQGGNAVSDKALRDAVQLLDALGYQVTAPADLGGGAGTRTRPSTGPATAPSPTGPPPGQQPPPMAPTSPPGQQPPTGTFPGRQGIHMTPVGNSSNVYAYGYNAETLTLRVQFLGSTINVRALKGKGHRGKGRVRGSLGRTNTATRRGPGPVYDYHGVPQSVFRRFEAAGSKGGAVWDLLRIRGTIYGHRYDYELVAASVVDVVQPAFDDRGRMVAGATVGRLTYVPRKAVGPGQFQGRTIRQGTRSFRSVLPNQGLGRNGQRGLGNTRRTG